VDSIDMAGESIDLNELERELCRVPEITAARVVADDGGRPVEVHILSAPTKHAKQVVRDVQSVAMASYGIDLDRRIISVVQLDAVATSSLSTSFDGDDDEDDHLGLLGDRITVTGVTANRSGLQCTAQVTLRRGDAEATGTAEGLVATSTVIRMVAQATVAALRHLEPAAARADVEAATVMHVGDRSVALTTVVLVVPPYEEIIAGSAVVRSAGELDAVARAVLDATNRRLPQLR
jgi:hypothetical protein